MGHCWHCFKLEEEGVNGWMPCTVKLAMHVQPPLVEISLVLQLDASVASGLPSCSCPEVVFLMFQVLGADTLTFKLHIQPGQPETPRSRFARFISHAGHGMGLQVFPGSVAEVVHVSWVVFTSARFL